MANDAEAAFTASMRVYQYYNALLYHLLQGCVDISGTHYRIDSDFITQHFMAGDLRDGKGYYEWAMSFKAQADPTAQGELIRKVYAKGLISVSLTGEALIKHITDMAADWAAFRLLRVPTPSTPLARTNATATGVAAVLIFNPTANCVMRVSVLALASRRAARSTRISTCRKLPHVASAAMSTCVASTSRREPVRQDSQEGQDQGQEEAC